MATLVYNNTSQAVLADGVFALTTVGLQKGCATESTLNGIKIVKPGLYNVTATVVNSGTTAGTIGVNVNGTAVPYAVGAGTTSTTTLTFPLAVNCNCPAVTSNLPATVQIVNTGTTTITSSNVSLYVEKIS